MKKKMALNYAVNEKLFLIKLEESIWAKVHMEYD